MVAEFLRRPAPWPDLCCWYRGKSMVWRVFSWVKSVGKLQLPATPGRNTDNCR